MKPSIPRGTRDFGPAEMQKRQYILDTIKRNYQLFGYMPLETPAMENITTLTGKYGEEGDQLIFKILNSRIHEAKDGDKEKMRQEFERSLQASVNSTDLTEKALRYDLTVPFARYVVMNHHNLTFPFKRYQVQPVWRADRPQRGRYREFYQCDADVIGSDSMLNELELIALMDTSFSELNIPVLIKFNNRKVLSGIAEVIDQKDKIVDITVAIDKLDKIGKEGVTKELLEKGIPAEAIAKLEPLIDLSGDNAQKVSTLKTFLAGNAAGEKGIEEIEFILTNLSTIAVKHATIELDITLARGLNYYTGTIFEAKANAGDFTPSILGGGRYDDLTGIFGLKGMSGVGISFGVDRIYDVMEELNLFPESVNKISSTRVLFAHFDKETQAHCIGLAAALRREGIACEIYPDITKKMGKQFEYANKKQIPFVCTVGSNEMASQQYAFKDLQSGEQVMLSVSDIIRKLKA